MNRNNFFCYASALVLVPHVDDALRHGEISELINPNVQCKQDKHHRLVQNGSVNLSGLHLLRIPAAPHRARLVFRNLPKREPAMRAEVTQISALTAAAAHALCFAGLAAGHALAGRGALISNPALALRLLVVCEAPVVIAVFSYLRRDPGSCSFFKAAARGLIGLPIGALLNAFGAIVLGAPVGIKYWAATIYWSLLMSLFTFVPAACVFGASKVDWQNVLSHSIYFTPTDVENYMISAPCHGAVLGAWLGAWPMPLDWERPWQEWPICVTYGAIAGRLVGMAVSLVLIVVHKRSVRAKTD
ncbi:hypothetical protein BS78_01G495300 [Paspalum vaginatum]|nr:hypothetical protein BS78_01G495300 [Paspalum vaginatum]